MRCEPEVADWVLMIAMPHVPGASDLADPSGSLFFLHDRAGVGPRGARRDPSHA
jgi:hypothetical protein